MRFFRRPSKVPRHCLPVSPRTFSSVAAPFILALAACTSAPPIVPIPPPVTAAPTPAAAPDLPTLLRSLRMDRAPRDLGYEEKAFNPCEFGFSSSDSRSCTTQFLVAIHFQLQCRDRDGTVEKYEVEPISSEQVRWTLGRTGGTTRTDNEGYGDITTIAPSSQRGSRLKITVGNNFMVLRAEEIRKVVTPPDWCGGP